MQKKLSEATLKRVEAELKRVKLAAAKAERAAASKLKRAEDELKRTLAKLKLCSDPAPAPDAVPDEQLEQAWERKRNNLVAPAPSYCAPGALPHANSLGTPCPGVFVRAAARR